MIQETYVTQETGMMIPEVISNYAYCKQIKKLNYNDELGNIQRLEALGNLVCILRLFVKLQHMRF
jgi:hypothetical protein